MIRFINKLKFREKGIVILTVSILIPMILTNLFFFRSIEKERVNQTKAGMENNGNQIEYEIKNTVRDLISIADYLKRQKSLDSFLRGKYRNEADYYKAYNDLMENNLIQYYYTAQSTWGIKIFTENDAIVNGRYFINMDIVKDQSPFREFIGSGQDFKLIYFYEDGERKGYIPKGRHIAVLERLDYFGRNDMIMLELDYSALQKNIMRICDKEDFYIYDKDGSIIISSGENDYRDMPFEKITEEMDKGIVSERAVKVYGEEFKIRLRDKNEGWFPMQTEEKIVIILLYLFDLILPSIVLYIIYRSINDRLTAMGRNLEKIKNGRYEIIDIEESGDELGKVVKSYNLMVETIKELIETVYKNKEREQELSIAKKQAEIHALQSQINPHFMFNALESIRMHSLIKGEEETEKILESFSTLLRESVQWDGDRITVEQEFKNVERYLRIQKYRFGSRLEYSVKVMEDCKAHLIPKFTVLTFVENACIHGIEKSENGGSISVIASCDEDFIYLEILNSGIGMTEDELSELRRKIAEADISYLESAKKSIGIINTVIRLKQIYGEKVSIEINSSVSGGTEVMIIGGVDVNEDNDS